MRFLELLESDEDEYDDPDNNEDDEETRYDSLPSSRTAVALRPQLAAAGQHVYDQWIQDEDDDLNGGGICHLIADKMVDVLSSAGINAWTVSSTYEFHVYCIIQCSDGIFEVDIPYRLYEHGGGFTWTKIPDVTFTPDDVYVQLLDGHPGKIDQYVEEG